MSDGIGQDKATRASSVASSVADVPDSDVGRQLKAAIEEAFNQRANLTRGQLYDYIAGQNALMVVWADFLAKIPGVEPSDRLLVMNELGNTLDKGHNIAGTIFNDAMISAMERMKTDL